MKKTDKTPEHIADMVERILEEAEMDAEERRKDADEGDAEPGRKTIEQDNAGENAVDENDAEEHDAEECDAEECDAEEYDAEEYDAEECVADEYDAEEYDVEENDADEYDIDDEYEDAEDWKPKKKKKRRRRVARWKKLMLTLEFMILAAIILAAVFLAQNGVFEVSNVKFGELTVEEIYYAAGLDETATFTVQAENSEMEMQLCDADETAVGTMHDDGQNGDETAGDGIYTCVLSLADMEAGAQTYHIKEAKTTSNEVTVYLFQTMSAEELETAGGVCGEAWNALRRIEAEYAGASGYVTVDDFDEIFAEAEAYLETLVADGTVIRYVVEDESAYIKFASGLSLCYEPILEDTFSGEDDVQLTVTYLDPGDEGYAADCSGTLESAMTQIENLKNGETLEGSEVTLSAVKSLASDQVIVWYGHGTYSSVTGSGLVLDIILGDSTESQAAESVSEKSEEDNSAADLTEESVSQGDSSAADLTEDDSSAGSLSAEEQSDLFKDLLTTVYLEDGEQHLAVTSAYVKKYCGDLSNDLIFLSACNGGKDSRLADAFLSCGAAAVLCFSDSVLCEYASGVIDSVLQYMMRAWPGSEWLYTLEQALERAEAVLGENDAVWLEKYTNETEELQDVIACGAEPVLLTGTDSAMASSAGTEGSEANDAETSSAGTEVTGTHDTETDSTEANEAGTDSAETNTAGTEEETNNAETSVSGIRLSTEKGSLSGTAYCYADKPEPAAGATVTICQAGELYMELLTDENGKYAVSALPVGTYDITFSLTGYGDYYQDDVVISRDRATAADGYFFTNTQITGTVTNALTGATLADVEVELLIGDGETIYKQTILTDENGDYTFDLTEDSKSAALSELATYFDSSDYSNLLEGSSVMTAKKLSPTGLSGYTMGIAGSGVILFEKDGYVSGEIEITVTGFDSPYVGVTELAPQVEIGGYVYDANGNVLGGVTISAVVTDDGSAAEQEEEEESEGSDGDGDEDDSGSGESESENAEDTAALNGTSASGGTVKVASGISNTASTAATGDTIETETDVDGYYILGFELGSTITIRVTYSLSGYDTKTVDYEIDSSMVVDGKVQLAGVSLTRTKQVVSGTAYAASVVSFDSGDPWTSMSDAMNPADALGEPDYSDNKNAVTLGAGGVLVLEFDVDFCNGDGIDIYIYEVGDDVERTLVEISRDGENWVSVGTVDGSTSGIDLEGLVSASSVFRYIRLTDLGSHTSGWWPGADIDAVAVLYYMQ